MQFQGALIKEQGVTFAIVVVKRHILSNRPEADKLIRSFQQNVFGGVPVVLMAQDMRGAPTYYGRSDIARFMSRVALSQVPWKQYSIS
jgi:hypothetical protein